MRVPTVLCPHQSALFILAILLGLWSHLIVALMCNAPMADDNDTWLHLFICSRYPFWLDVCSDLLSMFWLVSHRWAWRVLYVFQTPALCQTGVLWAPLEAGSLSSRSLDHVFHRAACVILLRPTSVFLCWSVFCMSYLSTVHVTAGHTDFSLMFSSKSISHSGLWFILT